jgi:predicted 3-demethylubiquinone-9 3-methyltransferase (glyoxalase superfamily)
MNNVIYPCLWFNGNAREAADFYSSVFKDSRINSDNQMVVMFESAGQKFMFLNGGPQFQFNPSVSFYVMFETESELDTSWEKLIAGGSALMPLDKYPWSDRYGWLQDSFGINWQLILGKSDEKIQKFSPALMFTGENNGKTEQAIHYYTTVFRDSEIMLVSKYPESGNDTAGNINHAQFRLANRTFVAMDSSFPHKFSFNEATSFVVECNSQEEIDYFWNALVNKGEEGQCGWLKDQYGVSWQIIPSILKTLMNDPSRSERVVKAFLQMKKFEIDKLINA